MTISRRLLCVVYVLIGLVALVGTWANNIAYLDLGLLGANVHFWQQTLANPASRSITVDILLLSVAVIVWMLLEARRLAMRGVWAYVLFGALVAISAAVPAFLIHRERTLAARDGSTAAGTMSARDLAGLAVLCLVSLAYTFVALKR